MPKIILIKRKECRVLTWQGKILLFILLIAFVICFVKTLPLFLSVNKPIGGNILVLDGQMPDFSVKEAMHIFDSGGYDLIVTTGGKIQTGYFMTEFKTMAEFTASTFVKMGFPEEKIAVIPGGEYKRDRTYNSALSLKSWIKEENKTVTKIDVLAVGSHARRSRLLFRKAMKDEFSVGIISVEDPAYNPRKWWTTSVGTRTILSETIAYFYVLFFFTD